MTRSCNTHKSVTFMNYQLRIWYVYAENNCAEVGLNKQWCLLKGGGAIFLSNRGVIKSWGHRFSSVKNIGVSTWNKQEIIGWLQSLPKFVFNDNHANANFPRYAYWGYICVYNNTLAGGGINFLLSNMGVTQILPRYLPGGTFRNLWTPSSKENWDLQS